MVNGKPSGGFSSVYHKLLLNLCFQFPVTVPFTKKLIIPSVPVLNLLFLTQQPCNWEHFQRLHSS